MSFIPYFGSITGSQALIPPGAKGYTITIQSGYGCINGTTIPAPQTFQGGHIDSKEIMKLGSGINIGTTGSAASPARINYTFEI